METTIPTALNDLAALESALKAIRKNKATLRKYAKAAKAGRVTADQLANARAVIREALTESLAVVMERGFALGQGDETSWDERAEILAGEMTR
jgi:hypothetical protein